MFCSKSRFTLPFLICFLCYALTASLSAQSIFDSLYDARVLEVHFASGKADIDPAAARVLDTVLYFFQQKNGEKTVRISAHTDAEGNTGYNEKLSALRANTVSKALIAKGLPENSIISVENYGERKPAGSNATETGRSQNRRATVEIARRVPMSILEGRISDKSTGLGVATTITFQSKTRKDSMRTDTSGRYRVSLPKDSIVKLEVMAKDYFFESVTMKILGSPELYKKYKLSPDIVLPPAKPGETVVLRNFYFVGGEARLLKVSEPELPKILKFMQLNPDLIIEIGGHVNVPYDEKNSYKLKPGQTPADFIMEKKEPWERALSLKRAEVVLHYLLQNGILPARMSAKGYNNSKMVCPFVSCNQEQQQMNRRVEISVTGRTGH